MDAFKQRVRSHTNVREVVMALIGMVTILVIAHTVHHRLASNDNKLSFANDKPCVAFNIINHE